MLTCLLPGIYYKVSLRQIQEKCFRVIVLSLLGGLCFGVEMFFFSFPKSCCIDVNRSRTTTFGSKQSVSAVVLHKRHAENTFRAAVMTSDKTSKFFLFTDCCWYNNGSFYTKAFLINESEKVF